MVVNLLSYHYPYRQATVIFTKWCEEVNRRINERVVRAHHRIVADLDEMNPRMCEERIEILRRTSINFHTKSTK